MRPIILLVIIIFLSCQSEKDADTIKKDKSLLFSYTGKGNDFSIEFRNKDTVFLKEATPPNKNLSFALISERDNKIIDSFLNRLVNFNNYDTVYFPPSLQVSGLYSFKITGDIIFQDSFTYGDNKPKVYYDFSKWVEDFKNRVDFNVLAD